MMPISLLIPTTSRAGSSAATLPKRLLTACAATLAVAIAAHIAFPLPFTPVPFSLQPLAVLLVGLLLGPVDGALAMVAYLLEGAAGLPVFSPTGFGGLSQLLGPTGGFLMAYPAVAFVCGLLTRRMALLTGAYVGAVIGGFFAVVLLFAAGAGWLGHLTHLQGHALLVAAIIPFLPGEAVKVLIAAGVYRALFPASRDLDTLFVIAGAGRL